MKRGLQRNLLTSEDVTAREHGYSWTDTGIFSMSGSCVTWWRRQTAINCGTRVILCLWRDGALRLPAEAGTYRNGVLSRKPRKFRNQSQ